MNWYLKVLQQFADFSTRARRKEYWMFTLFSALINILMIALDNYFDTTYGEFNESGYFETAYSLTVLVPSLAVGVRRMHDVGKSGWYILIPFYNFYLTCLDSEIGNNKWGDNPKGIGNDSAINLIGKE